MFLFSSPRCYTSQQRGEGALKVCKCTLAWDRENKEFILCQLLKPPVSTDRRFTFLISFPTSFCHVVSTVDKDWCARLCKDSTWGELHQKERKTLGLRCLQTLIVPACLHTCSGFTARLVNPSQDFKRRAESFTCTFTHAFAPCRQPAAQVERWEITHNYLDLSST